MHPMTVAVGSVSGRYRHRTAALQSLEDRLVSQFVTTSEVHAVVGEIRRQQVMDIVRGSVFVGALLLAWVTLQPFEDLSAVCRLAMPPPATR